jgi:hypothetical protein
MGNVVPVDEFTGEWYRAMPGTSTSRTVTAFAVRAG